jgi:copper chaperone NosL
MRIYSGTLTVLTASLFILSCSHNPEAIVFGKDQCHFCKMTIVDERFGAELVTTKGKVYKFDDVACFMQYSKSGYEDSADYKHKLVVDFGGHGALIDATTALYVFSPEIRSPMNGQLAAFQSEDALESANKEWNGTSLSWNELGKQSR